MILVMVKDLRKVLGSQFDGLNTFRIETGWFFSEFCKEVLQGMGDLFGRLQADHGRKALDCMEATVQFVDGFGGDGAILELFFEGEDSISDLREVFLAVCIEII